MSKYNEGDTVYIVREDRLNSRFLVLQCKVSYVTSTNYNRKQRYFYQFIDPVAYPERKVFLRREEKEVFSNKSGAENYKNYMIAKREINRKHRIELENLARKYNILEE